eukprot:TRINITY_DN2146_c0_g1_i1.p1 TRINITY_DN2146_c0_g1~~TRINITY_DN2146_c0_g1_i1.p1  ORF type:complete len:297 (-),score=68.14 TRINITY_DN2146_c0_g1_i1:788-1606(-)
MACVRPGRVSHAQTHGFFDHDPIEAELLRAAVQRKMALMKIEAIMQIAASHKAAADSRETGSVSDAQSFPETPRADPYTEGRSLRLQLRSRGNRVLNAIGGDGRARKADAPVAQRRSAESKEMPGSKQQQQAPGGKLLKAGGGCGLTSFEGAKLHTTQERMLASRGVAATTTSAACVPASDACVGDHNKVMQTSAPWAAGQQPCSKGSAALQDAARKRRAPPGNFGMPLVFLTLNAMEPLSVHVPEDEKDYWMLAASLKLDRNMPLKVEFVP